MEPSEECFTSWLTGTGENVRYLIYWGTCFVYRKMLQAYGIHKERTLIMESSKHRPTTNNSESNSTVRHEFTRPTTTGARRPTEAWTSDIHGTPSRLRIVGTKGANRAYNLRSAANKIKALTTTKEKPPETTSRRVKSEPLHKHVTIGPTHTAERAMKRRRYDFFLCIRF